MRGGAKFGGGVAENGDFCQGGSLPLGGLSVTSNRASSLARQRSVPRFRNGQTLPRSAALLTTAACGGLRSTPDCRPRRTSLHLSYSCATPFGPAILVTQDPLRTIRGEPYHVTRRPPLPFRVMRVSPLIELK